MTKSKNILEQEQEFLKLNAEIDSETKALMNELDLVQEAKANNFKLYSDFVVSEPVTQIESIKNELKNSVDSFELEELKESPSFPFPEYLKCTTDYSDRSELQNDSKVLQKEKLNRIGRSAVIVPSLVVAKEREMGLSLSLTRNKTDIKGVADTIADDVIPESLKGVGQEGVMRFLSAKVKLLSDQLDMMKKDEKKHLDKIKELQAYKEKSIEERDKLLQQMNLSKNALVKCEKHANNLSSQLQTVQTENNHMKKELESLKKETRQSSKNYKANEIKLNRTLEEVERLKTALQQTKLEDKETKEMYRKKTEDLSNAVRALDKQRLELLNGFKKQLIIIDNLKRQKDLIDAGKLLKSTEEDFFSYLDCNPPTTVRRVDNFKSVRS